MNLQHIELDKLKTANVNVRKTGAKDVDDLVSSIRSVGLLQPLLVRPNCEGFEVIAGQRRYNALSKLAAEQKAEPVPCIVMEDGDDAAAIEASLAENLTRLPMDEIDQYKAFAALVKQGKTVDDIAAHFGITERLVKQRLAIADLHSPILTAYRNEQIGAQTIRYLTMASKAKQKAWWGLFTDEKACAPEGYRLKDWLFGGHSLPVENALFDRTDYGGVIVSDLFDDEQYFDDAAQFWTLQNTAIAKLKDKYLSDGWQDVVVLDAGEHWPRWDHCKAPKEDGGRVYIRIGRDGEVSAAEGYITEKEAKRRKKAKDAGAAGSESGKPELTKSMQNYLDLHRHAAVRKELLSNSGLALRVAAAQIIAGSYIWQVNAEPQKASTEAIGESLAANKAETAFAKERAAVRALLGMVGDHGTLVPRKHDYGRYCDLADVFAKLVTLDDAAVMRVLTFVIAETLPSGNVLVEALGQIMVTDMNDHWTPDDTFFDLMRDKEVINAMLREVGTKITADAHLTETAKTQKTVLRAYLDGRRKPSRKNWKPRYMNFPMQPYTKRGGIDAVDRSRKIKKSLTA